MKICITRTKKSSYSETFIKDQIALFSDFSEVYPVHTGRFPERCENNALLSPYLFWLLHKTFKIIVGRNNSFSNYGMKKYLKENKIDVVLCNYGTTGSHMVPICKALNIPLLVIFHGHDATENKIINQYRTKYQKLFAYASYLIAVSEEIKVKLISYGAPADKIVVIPCGVDIAKFRPNETSKKENQFLAVGRFAVKKGPLHTIKAFYQVVRKYPEAKLIMAGSKGGLYSECEALVKELNLTESVSFTGILSPKEIALLMQTSIAFVQHSITAPNGDMEGTPVSIMEASASQLPVISTEHGGIKDAVVHNKTGFLVAEEDVDGMASYMLRLYENREEAKTMGIAARQHIEHFYLQSKQIEKIKVLAESTLL